VGIEAIGSASPVLDAEVIQTALSCFEAVDATGLELLVNSIGCAACRPNFLASLRAFLADRADDLPPDLRRRAETHPLRLYDAKDEATQTLLAAHPGILEFLCDACREHHERLKETLDDLVIPYREDATLVRGLDYYTRTTFEITTLAERKQSSLCGGGRYDHLVEQCGGPATPAIGFSVGIERTLLHLGEEPVDFQRSRQSVVDVYVACADVAAQRYGFVGTEILRGAYRVEVDTTGRSFKAQTKTADQRCARVLLVAGEDEITGGTFQLKNLETGVQYPVDQEQILTAVREVIGE
jgi:histidyl-tRNA synthetase